MKITPMSVTSPLSSPPWSARTKRYVTIFSLTLIVFAVIQLGDAWWPVIIAFALAYLLMPIVNRFEQMLIFIPMREVRRSIAVILSFVLVGGILIFLGSLVVQPLSHQLQEFAESAPDLLKEVQIFLRQPIDVGDSSLEPWQAIEDVLIGNDTTPEDSSDAFGNLIRIVLAPAAGILGGVFSAVISVLLTLALLFYASKDGPDFIPAIEKLIPPSYRGDYAYLVSELGRIWNAYFRGQLLIGIVIGLLTFIMASILGLPQPLVLGLLAGLLEFIPSIGPALSAAPAVLLALVTSSSTIPGLDGGILFALIVIATYWGIQVFEGFFLIPRVMGSSLNLHPFVVLVAILFGAKIAGILGIILASPITATLRLLGAYLWLKLFEQREFAIPSPSLSPAGPALPPATPPALTQPSPPTDSIAEGEIIYE
jgi:predicted PurR-regulated permease PerM